MAKKVKHKISLFSYYDSDDNNLIKLEQVVNVYEHDQSDFIRNFNKMIMHYRKHLGLGGSMVHALGQLITFRVYPGQEPMSLSLYKFAVNYIMMMPMILLGIDMTDWEPWLPVKFSPSAWEEEINRIIHLCRGHCTSYQMCEYIEWIKYELNQFVAYTCDILAMSISNNEFIELMNRDDDVRKSITCTFDIPEDVTPDVLERLTRERTKKLLNTMSGHHDLSCSVYAQNGLFNSKQASEFFVHLGYKPDLMGNTIPYTANTNMLMGTKDIRAHVIDAKGGRKAESLKLKVSDAGDFERSVSTLMSNIRYADVDYNCDSQHFRTKKIAKVEDVINLDGRVATFDKKHYFIIDPRDPKQKLVGKTIYMKTPITCCHPRRSEGYICSACYGKLLASINQDMHTGRISALNDADEMEQKLLSAKHALTTNTSEVEFTANFDEYFTHDNCIIGLHPSIVSSIRNSHNSDNLYLEINPASVTKHLDGENRHFDKSVQEIVIFNKKNNERVVITEKNGLKLFIHPLLNDEFYYRASLKSIDDPVRIKLCDIVDADIYDRIFEYQYKNTEIADPLLKLNRILNNGSVGINRYATVDECLDELIPLFKKGGIVIPDIHIEMLVACLVYTSDMKAVDWSKPNPDYKFCSIDTAIKYSDSVLTSLLYKDSNKQIAGCYGTYEKRGTSVYDVFLADHK